MLPEGATAQTLIYIVLKLSGSNSIVDSLSQMLSGLSISGSALISSLIDIYRGVSSLNAGSLTDPVTVISLVETIQEFSIKLITLDSASLNSRTISGFSESILIMCDSSVILPAISTTRILTLCSASPVTEKLMV